MLDIETVVSVLGYKSSPHYITEPSDSPVGVYSVFRQLRAARAKSMGFFVEGLFVYETARSADQACQNIALCIVSANSEDGLDAARRVVWNTGAIPFLLVLSDGAARLYQTFAYAKDTEPLIAESRKALRKLLPIRADEIDTGQLWKSQLADSLTPQKRVDQRLLGNLKQLRSILLKDGLSIELTHKLIGKYLYFRYLRDRGILSGQFLQKYDLSHDDVFSDAVTPSSFRIFSGILENRFNGKLFEIDFETERVPEETLHLFADVFRGADLHGCGDAHVVQLAFDFMQYDFEYIPAELLSKVYEMFLHVNDAGKKDAAYYTPEYLAEYVLNDIHDQCSMHRETKVLDPACGSGIFLSLSYRRLIEHELLETGRNSLSPDRLRDLLVNAIFGVELNREACEITAFSLILTLLHYVDPPALHRHERFRFPSLIGSNILNADFFDPCVMDRLGDIGFDWIVGNPPWRKLKNKHEADERTFQDEHALQWIQQHESTRPVPGLRIEHAFTWRVLDLLDAHGAIGLVLPSSGLVNDQAKTFRARFFNRATMYKVTNLSHVRRLLFEGAILPPSVWVYGLEGEKSALPVKHYAPKSIHLPTLRDSTLWAITVSESDIQFMDRRDIEQGEALPWKIAQWGCFLDANMLRYLDAKYSPLTKFLDASGVPAHHLARAPEFRTIESDEPESSDLKYMPDYVDAKRLNMDSFNSFGEHGIAFTVPPMTLDPMQAKDCYCRRKGGLQLGIAPFLFIGASWGNAFAYSDTNFVIPSRQYGLAGRSDADIPLLKAIAIYLSSSLVKYWMFFHNPEMGESDSKNRVTLKHIKSIPTPNFSETQILQLASLHDSFADEERKTFWAEDTFELKSGNAVNTDERQRMIDRKLARLLKLPDLLRTRLEDFAAFTAPIAENPTHIERFRKSPTLAQLRQYGRTLADALDGFTEGELYHSVSIAASEEMSCCEVHFRTTPPLREDRVVVKKQPDGIKRWLPVLKKGLKTTLAPAFYLQRNLRIYTPRSVKMFKATQNPDWTRTQAHRDASFVVFEALQRDQVTC